MGSHNAEKETGLLIEIDPPALIRSVRSNNSEDSRMKFFAILLMCFTGFTFAQDEEATDDVVTSNINAGFIDLADEVPEEEADEGEEESGETEEAPE